MYWFVRPPYLRYASAALIVLIALWMDLRPAPTEERWVARSDIQAGTALTEDLFRRADFPPGLFPPLTPSGVAAIPITEGDPLVASFMVDLAPPEGWWVVRLPLPDGVLPGTDLRIVLLALDPSSDPTSVPGLVIAPPDPGGASFGDAEGSVAIPADAIEAVARAVSNGRVTVLSR